MDNWTAVEDGLPEQPGSYLVKPRRGNIYIGTLCATTNMSASGWSTYWAASDNICGYCGEITHWMPLPDLPELEE